LNTRIEISVLNKKTIVMKKQKKSALLLIAASFIIFTACKKNDYSKPHCDLSVSTETSKFTAEVPAKWYALAIMLSGTTPNQAAGPVISRIYGYMGLALYESVVPGIPSNKSIQSQLNGMPALPPVECGEKYYYPASANAALADMVHYMIGNTSTAQNATIDSLENAITKSFISTIPKDVFDRSASFGHVISAAIYRWSQSDGGYQAYLNLFPSNYIAPTGSGLWLPQPGQFPQVPYWGNNRTFIKDNATSTQPPPPPAYSTDPGSKYYQEELEVYNESINQEAEHRAIALYWAALSPPSVSISILRSVLAIKNTNLALAAEAYCRVGIATCDANVSSYQTKYKYNQERPINFIQANFDPKWHPLLPTPPFPDYTSAHSVQTGAVARVLADIFGNNTTFTDFSINDLGFTPRTFTSFSDYANEVGLSRIYGGIHTRASDFIGLAQGDLVGRHVSALQFRKN
jgi:hypothetical protein